MKRGSKSDLKGVQKAARLGTLTVGELVFKFPGRTLLDGISFQLRPGAITCLLGGNGSGKTTLLNLLSGFLRPNSGSIRLGPIELTDKAPFIISRFGVARSFQDLRIIGDLSVRDNLLLAIPNKTNERLWEALLPPILHHREDVVGQAKVQFLLEEFALEEVADHLASDLSYGQQKLLTLACCAGTEARILLLDEPVAGIAPAFRDLIAERLARFRTAGKTILLIEHQPDFIDQVGDQFLFLDEGKLSCFETFSDLIACEGS